MPFAVPSGRLALLLAATVASLAAPPAAAQVALGALIVPPGTHVRFHLNQPLSTATSKSGETFTFTLLDPIVAGPNFVIPAGAQGDGTLVLSGHAGSQGHEGDLTLRLDRLDAGGGNDLAFDDQHFEVNGRNRKVASSLLGFVPLVGYGAMLIRGSESAVDVKTPLMTVLLKPAAIRSRDSLASPSPSAAASPSALPLPSPSPSPSP